jgi:hypothetical protein
MMPLLCILARLSLTHSLTHSLTLCVFLFHSIYFHDENDLLFALNMMMMMMMVMMTRSSLTVPLEIIIV